VEVAAGFALAAVRILERRADLARDQQRVLDLQREDLFTTALEDRGEALPFRVLVRDVVGLLDLPDPEDLEDVGALKLCRHLGLIHEASRDLGLARDRGGEPQDGDDLFETRGTELGRPVLLSEAGRAALLEKNQLAELLSDGHSVGCGK
jgi:hypothetical protein